MLLTLLAMAGGLRLFSTLAAYDDEGYVLISLQSHLAGEPLYDETYSQYGPAFYQVEGAFHQLTRWPLTHDATRVKTLLSWLATAALAAAIVWRLTGSAAAAGIAAPAAFLHLERLCLEPGHPQELCLLATLAALTAAAFAEHSPRPLRWAALLGGLTAVVVCTKINLGVFLGLPLGLALLLRGRSSRAFGWLALFAGGAGVLLPLVLFRGHLLSLTGMQLPVAVATAFAAVVLACWPARDDVPASLSPRPAGNLAFAAFVVATTGGVSICLTIALLQGTSPSGLWHGLIGQHAGFTERFYHDAGLPWFAAPLGVASLLAAIRCRGRGQTIAWAGQGLALGGLLIAGLCHLRETWQPLVHGLNDRGAAAWILAAALPAAWTVLAERRSLGRIALALVAALQPLAAFPTPGTQMAVGSLPLVILLAVALGDALAPGGLLRERLPQLTRALPAAWAMLLLGAVAARAAHLAAERTSLARLDLPGARWLALSPAEAEQWRWIAREIRLRGDTFVALEHGQNSLYFWTELPPPTSLNATFATHLLTDEQQRRIIASLDGRERACVLVDRRGPACHRPDAPLTRYLQEEFEVAAERAGVEIWTRRSRPPTTSSSTS